ncbi:McbB family protein [Granulicatella sp. zg-ZJ]|uniref:McbB family protein n=1 Tax=Granulicatella sp. zg-ZJ TaxID=2678504 RepID=UPI0013D1BA87|nr:McbB family protein [Granulicatella sp. zg-ZJ]NEW63121.1 McbB family protein [Granulicatella sp. zg-ZJ]
MYKVNPFILSYLEESVVVQNSKGIFMTSDEKLISLLEYIDKEQIKKIDIKEIIDFLNNIDVNEVINLMISNFILKEDKLSLYHSMYIDKFSVITDNKVIQNILNFVESENIILEEIISLEADTQIIILIPFNFKKLQDICSVLNNRNIQFTIVFPYNSKFYITNLYKKEWCNPCPRCFFSNLECSLRGFSKMYDMINFQSIIDMIYFENTLFEIETPINKVDFLVIINEICKFFKRDINYLANTVIEIDINDYTVKYDTCMHWELCDCCET